MTSPHENNKTCECVCLVLEKPKAWESNSGNKKKFI